MNSKIHKTKCLPQEIAGKVEIIKHAIKENLNHVLNAEKFAEKGKNCIFDSCVELVLLARSANKNPTYGWLCEEVYCVSQKEDCLIKPDIYKTAKSLGEVCVKLQPQQKENLRKVGCSRWQTIRKALSRYPKDKREKILNSLASASFDECSEALTQKVNDTASAANIQPMQKEKSERQNVRDYFNAILKNITDDTQLKALELYIANFNAPKLAMQNDTADKPAEASATQPQESSPEKSATPNQTSTENDSDSAIPKTPSDIPTTNTPAANTQPQEMQMELFPTLDEFGDCENGGTVREQQHVNKFIALSPKEDNAQNDFSVIKETLVAQPQEPSPEKSATPNQTSTENDSDSATPKTPSDTPITNTPAANNIQPQENPTNNFPVLDGLSDREKAKRIRKWLTGLEGRKAYKRDANSYEQKIAWAVAKETIPPQEVASLKTHEDLRKLAENFYPEKR